MDTNGHDTITAVIFEGIATLDVKGVAHDVYMTVRTEYHGYVVRWFGQFDWMGGRPDDFRSGGFFDLSLSDGREARIRIPHPSTDPGGKMDFLGVGLPPGFEVFTPAHMQTMELKSSTPFIVKAVNFWALLLMLFGVWCTSMAIWSEDNQWRYAGSAVFSWFVALCMFAGAGAKSQAIRKQYVEGGEVIERGDDDDA
ncbi:membrane protein [Streptomyces phage Zuko]|uniref:Membrane protein n=1 Tax=Streptomyces phage Zuko TaxID=2601695 RepID=A0A5J6D6X2_9CAUD|nr:membrane protein [Streptomyces phage Zuko]QEQ93580.1 membrane protein [Streptomyces phage Zuko]